MSTVAFINIHVQQNGKEQLRGLGINIETSFHLVNEDHLIAHSLTGHIHTTTMTIQDLPPLNKRSGITDRRMDTHLMSLTVLHRWLDMIMIPMGLCHPTTIMMPLPQVIIPAALLGVERAIIPNIPWTDHHLHGMHHHVAAIHGEGKVVKAEMDIHPHTPLTVHRIVCFIPLLFIHHTYLITLLQYAAWRSPHAVGRPLPSVFSDLDDICKLPPHTSLPPGMSVSKYFLNKGADEFNENIRNTEDWPFMMGDPIFSEFPSDGETIPVKDLINRQKDMMAAHKYVPPKPIVEETTYDSEQADEPEIPDDASYAGSEEQGQANGAESPEENGSYTGSEQGRDHDREYKRHHSQAWNTEDNTNTPMSTTPGNNDSDERPQTPQRYSKPQSFHGSYHRKRAREESLELPDDEIQRQVDDVAPRLERRHPRVAEAYRYDINIP
ncbi:uncharacterized protein ARB_03051 [Trichophyton benhamiae CBS 112371]|uniref:Uncharacterized protein n=1 Tax=Arthroderma benhamiae (strain ATCC MYA-4681 / CBS 112371) TaxID=663331 RepID=D4B3L2_ARTBC|nr:uncharacterized protein ARB_03051 [Trichophyton benhamiae CBS 112371]EFE29710.1 hypothetical protein ARB_03051 [Trichophyton benhamiae CBS 112371]